MQRKQFIGISFIAVVVLVAIGALVWWRFGTSVADVAPREVSVIRSSSGGLAGRGDGKNFSITNLQLRFGDQIKTLNQQQLNALVDKIDETRFFSLASSYTCEGCADQFTYQLSITLGTQSKTVTFEDGSKAPSSLTGLDGYLVNLLP